MKKIIATLALCIMTLSSWMAVEASAQNKIFSKYNETDNVDYICITKSMLKLIGSSSATINGVHIDGITNAIDAVLIISSRDGKTMAMMKDDFKKLTADKKYEMLMQAKSDGERVTTLLNSDGSSKEVVMYIDEKDNLSFVVLVGHFTSEQLSRLLDGNK